MTRINWISKELEKDLPQKEKMLHIQNLNNATNKVLEIVDLFAGIKNINDNSSYFFEAVSIRDIVEESIVKHREEISKKNIIFNVSTFKDIPLLTLDTKKISFVIDSLIENAILYTQAGGEVSIDSAHDGQKLILLVQDNGMGLHFRDKIKIFSRFYRSKEAVLKNPDGMGLRLYLSKEIIKRHNGKIYTKSNKQNKGATFFIELPFSK
ncbi:MAG: ATP-binding protein [Patescibacteria group bacterium]